MLHGSRLRGVYAGGGRSQISSSEGGEHDGAVAAVAETAANSFAVGADGVGRSTVSSKHGACCGGKLFSSIASVLCSSCCCSLGPEDDDGKGDDDNSDDDEHSVAAFADVFR